MRMPKNRLRYRNHQQNPIAAATAMYPAAAENVTAIIATIPEKRAAVD